MERFHSEKTHQCSDCGELFQSHVKLETHIAFHHDRSKLLECQICNAQFRTKGALNTHMSWVHDKSGSGGKVITAVDL